MKLKLEGAQLYQYTLSNEKNSHCIISPCNGEGSAQEGISPMELVAGGVAACIMIDLQSILLKQRMDPNQISVEVIGHRTGGVPSPFKSIDLGFNVPESLDTNRLAKNIQLVIDKYCSVSASLNPEIKITFKINEQIDKST